MRRIYVTALLSAMCDDRKFVLKDKTMGATCWKAHFEDYLNSNNKGWTNMPNLQERAHIRVFDSGSFDRRLFDREGILVGRPIPRARPSMKM